MSHAPRLLLIASASDGGAREFVARHARAGAALLTPRDLSHAGWSLRLKDPAATWGFADGRQFRLADVAGVLMRLPTVSEHDLPHIVAADRAYVAAELSAFLLAILTETLVPVVNRPTPRCLCGPAWHDTKWHQAAASLRLLLGERHWGASLNATESLLPLAQSVLSVVIVGDVCLGAPSAALERSCRALARLAGVEMLTIEFDARTHAPVFLRAYPQVDLGAPLVEAAVLGRFGMAAADAAYVLEAV